MIQDQEGGNSRSGGQEQSRRVQAERRLQVQAERTLPFIPSKFQGTGEFFFFLFFFIQN